MKGLFDRVQVGDVIEFRLYRSHDHNDQFAASVLRAGRVIEKFPHRIVVEDSVDQSKYTVVSRNVLRILDYAPKIKGELEIGDRVKPSDMELPHGTIIVTNERSTHATVLWDNGNQVNIEKDRLRHVGDTDV